MKTAVQVVQATYTPKIEKIPNKTLPVSYKNLQRDRMTTRAA